MDPPRNPVIEQEFKRQFEAGDELRAFAQSHLEPWSGREFGDEVVDVIILAEGARATKTFRAALVLCGAGYAEQAAMLNRGLFEGMVVAHWASLYPEEATTRYDAEFEHNQILWADTLRELGWAKSDELPPPPTDERRRELEALFGRHGTRLWTGHQNLPTLINDIKHLWDSESGANELRDYFRIGHRDNNLILHSGSWALENAVLRDAESFRFDMGPSRRRVSQALYGAFWCYLQTFSLLMDHFDMPDRSHLNEIHMHGVAPIIRLTDAQMRRTGRNDACPCGSGQKFKRCHGR